MSAINANRTLKFTHWNVSKSMEQLSSGERINKAGDDASGVITSYSIHYTKLYELL